MASWNVSFEGTSQDARTTAKREFRRIQNPTRPGERGAIADALSGVVHLVTHQYPDQRVVVEATGDDDNYFQLRVTITEVPPGYGTETQRAAQDWTPGDESEGVYPNDDQAVAPSETGDEAVRDGDGTDDEASQSDGGAGA